MDDHLPPSDSGEWHKNQAREATSEVIMGLRTLLNGLHRAMLATADDPNPDNQKKCVAAAAQLAGTAIHVAQSHKETYDKMMENPLT